PTLIPNRSPITTGDGTAHTAKLVAWGLVLTETGSAFASCRTPSASCGANTTLKTCSPTCCGALSVTSAVSLIPASQVAISLATATPSGAVTLTGMPRKSHPAGHDTLTFKMISAPTATSDGTAPLSSIVVECV